MAKNKVNWVKGKVRWFDPVRGEGFLRDEEGNSYFINESILENVKNSKKLKQNKTVKFKLSEDIHFVEVEKILGL